MTRLMDDLADGELEPVLRELSDVGKRRIEEHYQWDSVTDEYEKLLQHLQRADRGPDRRIEAARP